MIVYLLCVHLEGKGVEIVIDDDRCESEQSQEHGILQKLLPIEEFLLLFRPEKDERRNHDCSDDISQPPAGPYCAEVLERGESSQYQSADPDGGADERCSHSTQDGKAQHMICMAEIRLLNKWAREHRTHKSLQHIPKGNEDRREDRSFRCNVHKECSKEN